MNTIRRRFTALHLTLCAVLVALGALAFGVPAHAQSAGNGLEESSVNTFQIDQDTGDVRVTVEISLRNVTPDRRQGDVVNRTYFDAYGIVVPVGAENIVATRNGSTLSGELIDADVGEAFSAYQFELGTRLFNGQSTAIVVTYDHTGQPPRSELLWRANPAYASFLAFGLGDAGAVTVNLVLPSGYEFDDFTDLDGFLASEPNEFGATTYTRTGLDETFSTIISLSNDDLLTSTPLDVPGADLVLRSWPDDPEWVAFAKDKVETGVPELAELIGAPWPLDRAFDIRQTVEPNFAGYAGWFDDQESEIAVGEELDADTMYHELSHAWFNRDLFSSRWLSEGMAEVYAAEMIERDGDTPPEPRTPPLSGLGRQPLSQWTNFSANDDTENYGYNAAHFVMDAVADDIGFDAMAEVLAAARTRQIAYPVVDASGRAVDEPRASDIIDWRRMLDYFEFVGGSTVVDEVFREYVIAESDLDELEERSAARAGYERLAEQAAPWSMPTGIRERMDIWAFQRAQALQVEAADVLELRSTVEELATSTGVPPSAVALADAAAAFAAAADDFDDVTDVLDVEIRDGEALVDLQASIAERSGAAGTTAPPLSEIEGLDGFGDALPVAADQLDALDAVIDAADARAAPRSFTARIGLWGTDVDGDLDAARAAVAAGDLDAARERADEVVRTIDGAGDVGSTRLSVAIAAIGATLLLATAVAVVLRRRRRSGGGVVDGEFGDRDVDLDEDALAGTGLGGMDDVGDVALADPGEASGTARVVERSAVLSDVRDPVLELDEHVGTVVDADSVAGTEVLIDPDTHDEIER